MNTTQPDKSSHEQPDAPLNPALKREHDASYGPDYQGTDPMAKVSVQKDEGTVWPMIWAVVTIVSVIITIVLVLS